MKKQEEYLDGLRQVFDGQVEPDAKLKWEDVLPVWSILYSETNKQISGPVHDMTNKWKRYQVHVFKGLLPDQKNVSTWISLNK